MGVALQSLLNYMQVLHPNDTLFHFSASLTLTVAAPAKVGYSNLNRQCKRHGPPALVCRDGRSIGLGTAL